MELSRTCIYDSFCCVTLYVARLMPSCGGHSDAYYQIGDSHYQIWTLCPQLHHCIRLMFSLCWIIRILNTQVQNWLNIATHTYDNINVLNKGDDEVRWWLSLGRSKVIIMVPIWKCVGLTPIWSNFPDVHHFHTHILKNYLLLFYWFCDHLLIEELTVTVPTGTKSGHILSFWHGLQFVPYKMVLILIIGISDLVRFTPVWSDLVQFGN